MDYLIFLVVLVVQAIVILFPEVLNSILFARVPSANRMDAERHVPVATVALLVFTVLFFDSTYRAHADLFPVPTDTATVPTRYILGSIFVLLGLVFCIWPVRLLRAILRNHSGFSVDDNAGLLRFVKLVGIVQLVGGAYWLFRMIE
jgi:hypothetical protein